MWSLETPNLYKAVTTLEVDGKVADLQDSPTFGIRTLRFDADKGFLLNGKAVKIKGTCNHQDHAGVGEAIPDRIQAYRLERLKWMGSNGCRTSHNPPTPEFLDACDRMGMLVMDETRMMSSNPEGMSELERLIKRDRNHPSVGDLVAGVMRSRSKGNTARCSDCADHAGAAAATRPDAAVDHGDEQRLWRRRRFHRGGCAGVQL